MLYYCLYRRSMKPFGCKVAIVEPQAFKTSLTDNLLSLYERSWNQCSLEMKEEYASEYAKCKKRNGIKVQLAY